MKNKDLESLTHQRHQWWPQHYLFMVLMMVLSLMGCHPQHDSAVAIVSGIVPVKSSRQIKLYELTPDKILGVDSAMTAANGTFHLTAHPAETGLYLLQYDDENGRVAMVLDQGDSLTLSVDTNGFYTVSGNEGSRLLMKNSNAERQLRQSLDSVGTIVLDSRSQDDFVAIKSAADHFVDSVLATHRQFVEGLILQNPSALASLLLVNSYFSGSQLFPIDLYPDLYRVVADSTGARYPGNAHVAHHRQRVERVMQQRDEEQKLADRILPGRPLPTVSLPDADGNMVALTSFSGKPIIIFLWASWSPESRAAIQQLKALYTNVPIFAISFDNDKNIWKAALKIENTPWTQVIDPQGMSGAAAKLFGASRHLPYFILADSSGKIVASTARFSELAGAIKKLNLRGQRED
jgi:hypothetical protein